MYEKTRIIFLIALSPKYFRTPTLDIYHARVSLGALLNETFFTWSLLSFALSVLQWKNADTEQRDRLVFFLPVVLRFFVVAALENRTSKTAAATCQSNLWASRQELLLLLAIVPAYNTVWSLELFIMQVNSPISFFFSYIPLCLCSFPTGHRINVT